LPVRQLAAYKYLTPSSILFSSYKSTRYATNASRERSVFDQ
jgi:hypothetical protein